MKPAPGPNAWGLRVIGATKFATALLLGAAGLGIFRLLNGDLGEFLEHVALRLHLDPENRLVHEAIYQVAGIDRAHLKAIGAGSLFYALLELVEGVGLILRRRWAEYLTVVATVLLLPPEAYEIAQKVSMLRVGVLILNLAVLGYLIVKLRAQHRGDPEKGPIAT
jgi:uncharacterized membrane protein (DUF2068 family)